MTDVMNVDKTSFTRRQSRLHRAPVAERLLWDSVISVVTF